MRVALVVPPRRKEQILSLLPPYPLGYLATACRKAGHEPWILDCPIEGLDAVGAVRRIVEARSEAVGVTVFSPDVPAVADLCARLKALPDAPWTVLGGIHPSSYPEPTLRDVPHADFLFVGEAEEGLPLLLGALAAGRAHDAGALDAVPGLVRRAGEGARLNPRAKNLDLDALGQPAWDLMEPLRYQRHPPTLFVRRRPFAPIVTTRGCPYLCTYCAGHNASGYRIRNRSLDAVFEEIRLLRERFGVRELHIEDDNFTWRRGRVMEFCDRMLASGWNMTWTMPNGVRLDTLDLELLRHMRKAGCYFLILGVESGSDRILRHMRKKITVAQVEEKAALVARAGILCHAFFMLGYPAETEADFRATLDLALRLPLIGAHFSSFRPLPGTQSAEELVARGEIEAFDFASERSTFASVVYAPPGMTTTFVKAWQKRMLRRFYFRPRILARYALEMLHRPGLIVNLLRRAWLYLFGS